MCKYSSYFHLLWDLLCKSFLQIGYFCKSHITIYSHLQNIIQCKSHKTNHLVSPFKLFPWFVWNIDLDLIKRRLIKTELETLRKCTKDITLLLLLVISQSIHGKQWQCRYKHIFNNPLFIAIPIKSIGYIIPSLSSIKTLVILLWTDILALSSLNRHNGLETFILFAKVYKNTNFIQL